MLVIATETTPGTWQCRSTSAGNICTIVQPAYETALGICWGDYMTDMVRAECRHRFGVAAGSVRVRVLPLVHAEAAE